MEKRARLAVPYRTLALVQRRRNLRVVPSGMCGLKAERADSFTGCFVCGPVLVQSAPPKQ